MPRNARPDTPDARTLAGLKAFQRTLAAAVMAPLTPQDGMKRGTQEAKAALPLVKPNDRLTSFERLEIYNVQYWLRVREALREDFPALAAALGEKKFEALARAYLAACPSRSHTLRNLGGRLPDFLAKSANRKWTAPLTALALDIARFEWAQVVAFDETELPPAGSDLLGGDDPGKLRFRLQPHLTLLALNHPVDAFVLALRHDHLRSEASNVLVAKKKKKAQARPPLPKPEKTWIAVHRSDQLLYTKRLSAEEYRLLAALGAGRTLAQACDAAFPKPLPKRNPEPEMDRRSRLLGSAFRLWGELGWLAKR
ncbi:MAG TPA: DNA-binding domain-containing protein [Candidatus Methylacidiphilales bacterium]